MTVEVESNRRGLCTLLDDDKMELGFNDGWSRLNVVVCRGDAKLLANEILKELGESEQDLDVASIVNGLMEKNDSSEEELSETETKLRDTETKLGSAKRSLEIVTADNDLLRNRIGELKQELDAEKAENEKRRKSLKDIASALAGR